MGAQLSGCCLSRDEAAEEEKAPAQALRPQKAVAWADEATDLLNETPCPPDANKPLDAAPAEASAKEEAAPTSTETWVESAAETTATEGWWSMPSAKANVLPLPKSPTSSKSPVAAPDDLDLKDCALAEEAKPNQEGWWSMPSAKANVLPLPKSPTSPKSPVAASGNLDLKANEQAPCPGVENAARSSGTGDFRVIPPDAWMRIYDRYDGAQRRAEGPSESLSSAPVKVDKEAPDDKQGETCVKAELEKDSKKADCNEPDQTCAKAELKTEKDAKCEENGQTSAKAKPKKASKSANRKKK